MFTQPVHVDLNEPDAEIDRISFSWSYDERGVKNGRISLRRCAKCNPREFLMRAGELRGKVFVPYFSVYRLTQDAIQVDFGKKHRDLARNLEKLEQWLIQRGHIIAEDVGELKRVANAERQRAEDLSELPEAARRPLHRSAVAPKPHRHAPRIRPGNLWRPKW